MAIKVVGKDKKLVLRVTCAGCASILEYTLNDVEHRSWREIDQSSGGCEYIQCPSCKKDVILKVS